MAAGQHAERRISWTSVRPNGRGRPNDLNRLEDPHLSFVIKRTPGAALGSRPSSSLRLLQLDSNPEAHRPLRASSPQHAELGRTNLTPRPGRRQGQAWTPNCSTGAARAPCRPALGCGGSLNPLQPLAGSNGGLGPWWLPGQGAGRVGHDGALTVAMRRCAGWGVTKRGERFIESILTLQIEAMGQLERQTGTTQHRSPEPFGMNHWFLPSLSRLHCGSSDRSFQPPWRSHPAPGPHPAGTAREPGFWRGLELVESLGKNVLRQRCPPEQAERWLSVSRAQRRNQ